jgi:hypothetical protein
MHLVGLEWIFEWFGNVQVSAKSKRRCPLQSFTLPITGRFETQSSSSTTHGASCVRPL